MNKKHLLNVFIVAISILYGCSKEALNSELLLEKPRSMSNTIDVLSGVDGEYDWLGYGYDVTGEYANPSAARYKVLDILRLKTDAPNRVEIDPSQFGYGRLVSGANAAEYSKSLSGNMTATVGLGIFGGTIKASFSDSSSFSSKYVYSSYDHIIQRKALKFSAPNELLKSYLTADFLSDVQSESPANLVLRYGTHVMSDIILGGKLQIMYRSESTETDRFSAAKAGIDASMKAIFSINANLSTNSAQSDANFTQSLNYKTIGGDPSIALLGQIPLGQSLPVISISGWQSSVTIANSQLIDIRANGLMPIYELIDDVSKRNAVKTYIDQYLSDNQVKVKTEPVHVFGHNNNDPNHIYTINRNDYPYEQHAFTYLGVNFHAYGSQVPGTQPVHVFTHDGDQNHVYTINRFDYPYESNGFTYRGVNFYAFPSQVSGTYPVHCFGHNGNANHVYTINKNDYPYEQNGFTYLGIAFYAYKTPS